MARPSDNWRQRRDFASRPIKEQVKDLLSLTRSERRGSAFLVLLLTALFVVVAYQQWLRPPRPTDAAALRAEMQAWLAQRDSINRALAAEPAPPVAELFPFDPNRIGQAEWLRLGLSERQAGGIERFKAKGGRFRTKSDLGRMYTLGPEQFQRLKPYILLPDSLPRRSRMEREDEHRPTPILTTQQPREHQPRPDPAPRPRGKVEVNSADTAALIALPGIGPSFARGIVKYREALGGYRSLDQLAEVHVLKDKPDAVARLKELLTVDTLAIRRIPLNACSVEELAAHPYARWRIAKPVIAYRQQHGPFTRIDDLRAIPVFDEEGLRKLAPYLSLE